jgi:hypothetical protein
MGEAARLGAATIMDMDPATRLDIGRGGADGLAIFENLMVGSDCSQSDLMADRDPLLGLDHMPVAYSRDDNQVARKELADGSRDMIRLSDLDRHFLQRELLWQRRCDIERVKRRRAPKR